MPDFDLFSAMLEEEQRLPWPLPDCKYEVEYTHSNTVNIPKYPAPAGLMDNAAIPSAIALSGISCSAQSKPSASPGRLSAPDGAEIPDSTEFGSGFEDCPVVMEAAAFDL